MGDNFCDREMVSVLVIDELERYDDKVKMCDEEAETHGDEVKVPCKGNVSWIRKGKV